MRLDGVSLAVFAAGAAALALAVFALHLLRVRLRRAEVDTLLFFELAGAVRQPRVLPGRPARWLSLLLALAAAGLAWGVFADPHTSAAKPSRIVVVEAAGGAEREARLAEAAALVAGAGLGPRGAVVAAGSPPRTLLAADEPAALLAARAAALPEAAGNAAGASALAAAAGLLRAGDEVVWLGARPAQEDLAVPVRRVPSGALPGVALHALRWLPAADGASWLALDGEAPAGAVVAWRGDDGTTFEAELPAGVGHARLGPLRGAGRLRLAAGGREVECALPPPAPPVKVAVGEDLDPGIRSALDALCAAHGGFIAGTAAEAEVLVVREDTGDPRPCLVVDAGAGGGPREPRVTAEAPCALSLRDRVRRDAPALAAREGATVWVVDEAQGDALAFAARAPGGAPRVRIVSWLLQPATHADVPVLLDTALQVLTGAPRAALAAPGEPVVLAAGLADAAFARGDGGVVLPAGGRATAVFETRGAHGLDGPAGRAAVHVVDARVPAPPSAAGAGDDLDPRGGSGALAPWLLALLFAVLLAEAILFHRGRLP